MAIDPRDYEKYSGRKGDPHSRLGAALAGSDSQKAQTAEAKSRNTGGDVIVAGYWSRYVIGGVVLVIVGAIVAISRLF